MLSRHGRHHGFSVWSKSDHRENVQKTKRVSQLFYKKTSEFFNNLTFSDENMVCAKSAHTTPHGAIDGKTQTSIIELYNLDVIISVGYRVKSHRGVQFRRWANSVPKDTTQKGIRLPALTMCFLGNYAYLCPTLPLTVFRRGIVALRYLWSSPAGLAIFA